MRDHSTEVSGASIRLVDCSIIWMQTGDSGNHILVFCVTSLCPNCAADVRVRSTLLKSKCFYTSGPFFI